MCYLDRIKLYREKNVLTKYPYIEYSYIQYYEFKIVRKSNLDVSMRQ